MVRSKTYHGNNVRVNSISPAHFVHPKHNSALKSAGAAHALDGPGGPKETPFYLGRAIVALASNPRVLDKSGELLEVGALAQEYGFTDLDGTQPAPFRLASPA